MGIIRNVRKPRLPFIVAPEKAEAFIKIIKEPQEHTVETTIAAMKKKLAELDKEKEEEQY